MANVGVDALSTSTTLEADKSLLGTRPGDGMTPSPQGVAR